MGEPPHNSDIPGIEQPSPSPDRAASSGRAWLGVSFKCCDVYGRIYKSREGTQYVGRCPRCGGEVHARVGEGGTSQRFFETS